MILLIDNYDSFVHNLARYVGMLGHERMVLRNDAADAAALMALRPDAIILSPGPKGPDSAGVSCALVEAAAKKRLPLLGVCLGHQCIAHVFGGRIRRNPPVHGRASAITHDGSALFAGLSNPFHAARYHSLAVDLPQDGALRATAFAGDGTLMALAHMDLPIFGVQFHPESVLTDQGAHLLDNFLNICGLQSLKNSA